jgi:anti-sigma B factor antagonist
MALQIAISKMDGAIVVYLSGAILFGEDPASLRIFVKQLLKKSHQVVLDLEGVTHIDSGGVGTLVGLYVSARRLGGDIKLASLSSHANEVLQVTKIGTIIEIFDKAEDAVGSFKRAATHPDRRRRA